MTVTAPVITIDGPGGAGKGTIARLLAQKLGWNLLDSGVLYRVTALAADKQGVALDDATGLHMIARGLDVHFSATADSEMRIWLANEDVTDAIRSEQCGNAASQVAVVPAVRAALLQRQREFRRPPGLVADGRDMGSVVFPDAEVKIFLTASVEERAQRRYKQLREKGIDANLLKLAEQIKERDARDTGRSAAPLQAAPDAYRLDTTGLNIDEVLQRILSIVHESIA